jgi:pSer/pThr/pTyr-binding forkhead associated (FHA) protein
MDQTRFYVCQSCMTPVPTGHKFCGRCGGPVPDEIMTPVVRYYSDMQNPERARVVLVRGEGMEGLSYHLKADQHLLGRQGQLEFPDDPFISPAHANFFYVDSQLVVRDEGSLNGVYVRVRGAVEIAPGTMFMAGDQVFRLDATPPAMDAADAEGTYFYASPRFPSGFRVSQLYQGGAPGVTVCSRTNQLTIGREDCDLNFPMDDYLSVSHCSIEDRDGHYILADHDSRNGTYVRIMGDQPLGHGDYVYVGKKLLRVEQMA